MYYRDELGNWQEIILEPSGDTLPIGFIGAYGGETAPTGWLICDGTAYNKTDYPELYNAIGTAFNEENDSETVFRVPDLTEGKVPVGMGGDGPYSLGATGGEEEHKLTYAELPAQTVTGYSADNYKNWSTGHWGDNTGASYATNIVQYSGKGAGDVAHNNMPPYVATNYIIKAKQSIGIVGTVSEDITDTNDNAVPNCETVKNYVDKANIECMLSSTPSPATGSYVDVSNLKIINGKNYDGKFSISNGKVVIGNGVSKIKVTRIINVTTTSGSGWTTLYSYLRKNSSSVNNSWLYVDAPAIRTVVGISEDIVDVEENDIISFSTYCDLGYNINNNATKMIIEEI